jgi:hypothetical protein
MGGGYETFCGQGLGLPLSIGSACCENTGPYCAVFVMSMHGCSALHAGSAVSPPFVVPACAAAIAQA